MTAEQNKALVTRYIQQVWEQGETAIADEVLSDNFFDNSQNHNREQVKQTILMIRSGFPDLTFNIEEMLAEGDKVALRYHTVGTHQNSFMGIPPTGKQIRTAAMSFYQIKDGKIVASWGITDTMSMLQQLGVRQ